MSCDVAIDGTPVGAYEITLESTRPAETVRTGRPSIDPDWVYTDQQGHEHHGDQLSATLIDFRVPCYCGSSDEPHDRHSHWECRRCGQVVKPGTLPPGTFTVVGELRTTIRLDGPEVARLVDRLATGKLVGIHTLARDGSTMTCEAVFRDGRFGPAGGYVVLDVIGECKVDRPMLRNANR